MLDGYFQDKLFILPIRIYYADTDLSGVVYHANYLNYMERARSEYFRAIGVTKLANLEEGEATAWALRKATLDFVRPARFDDVIEVRTTIGNMTGVRVDVFQETWCGDQLLVRGMVQACLITLDGRPRRIPQYVRDKLLPYLVDSPTE